MHANHHQALTAVGPAHATITDRVETTARIAAGTEAWADPDPDRAFADAYERHRAGLLVALRVWTRDEAAAEDLCQEAFTQLYRALVSGQPPIDTGHWLKRVAHNLAISRARRSKVAVRHAPSLYEADGGDPTVSMVLERERAAAMRTALLRLSAQDREVLLLAAYGLSRSQIARRLATRTGTVRTRLHRARRRLQGELAAHDAGQSHGL
jgi:RNA polymerase sigma-70 factor (ECF subfamily)